MRFWPAIWQRLAVTAALWLCVLLALGIGLSIGAVLVIVCCLVAG